VCAKGDSGVMTTAGIRAEPQKPFKSSTPKHTSTHTHPPSSPKHIWHTRRIRLLKLFHTNTQTRDPSKWALGALECVQSNCRSATADVWRRFCW